ncbi:MAG: PP2C family serine/threonine-protein phosphatase, partial [Patescibacteria group bacterium]
MELDKLTPDTTFPYRLFRFAHKRQLNSVSSSYFAIVSKDSHPVGLVLSIDIDERWHHARSAATTFWQILVREFNHSESRSTLIRFEAALKELNKAVVKTQEKVRQPISVAAAILESNQIHFSTIGTSRILLVRSGKFSDVTSGPEKGGNQFAAVTSGDVDANDTLIIANQNIYEFLAAEPDELWQPREIDLLCQEIQSRAQNSEQALNCLIMRYDPDRPAQQTLYWEESEKHYPIKLPKFSLPTLPKIALPQLKLPTIPPSLKRLALPKLSLPTNFQQSAKVLLTRVKVIKPRTLLIAAVVIGLAIVGGVLKSRFSAAVSDEQAPVSLTDQFAGTSG